MTTCERSSTTTHAQPNATDALHRVKELALHDPMFAVALQTSETPQAAADLARQHGIEVSPAALWRQRGTLGPGGRQPTWRG
jgi:hypothetical protein